VSVKLENLQQTHKHTETLISLPVSHAYDTSVYTYSTDCNHWINFSIPGSEIKKFIIAGFRFWDKTYRLVVI